MFPAIRFAQCFLFAGFAFATASAESFRDPKEILEILEKSKFKYEISQDSSAFFDLRNLDASPVAHAHPDWIVVVDSKGARSLKQQIPTGCAAKEDSAALTAYSAKDYKAAADGYRRAYECDKSFVKALTYVGNSYFGMGKLDSAIFWLRKAIEANPDDYQAHFFLADAYLGRGKADSAYAEFIEAYLRNPNSENLRRFGSVVLDMNGKQLDKSWPVFGFAVDSLPKGARIRMSDMAHLPMATCIAAWTVDPELKSQRKDDDPIQQTRFRNCLANQFLHAATSKRNGRPVDRISEKLARIADGNLIGTMVVWERLARSRPESIYTLPPEVKARIRAYLAEALELR